jgi:hypothetical protein
MIAFFSIHPEDLVPRNFSCSLKWFDDTPSVHFYLAFLALGVGIKDKWKRYAAQKTRRREIEMEMY